MKIKEISREKLIIRPAFPLFFGNGEIWCEELDSLSIYTDAVTEKFLSDLKEILRPSSPSAIVVNLNETLVDENVADTICGGLCSAGNAVRRVAFAGLDRAEQKLFKKHLSDAQFAFSFINDYEKAKEWLVGK